MVNKQQVIDLRIEGNSYRKIGLLLGITYERARQIYFKEVLGINLTKESSSRYNQSEKGKASRRKYLAGPKGQEAIKRYQSGPKFKATLRHYYYSDKGQKAHQRYQTKVKQREHPEGHITSEPNIQSISKDSGLMTPEKTYKEHPDVSTN